MTSVDHVERLRWPGVLLQSYLSAGRHLARLALPGVMVHVPLATLSLLVLAVASSGSAAVVNGRFQLIGISDDPLLIWTGVLTVVAIAGELLVFPATVILAVGCSVERPVPAVAALRATARRLPALLVLLLVAGLVFAAVVAAGAGVLLATEAEWAASMASAVLALVAMPGLLAVPSVVLHGCTALGAIGRAYRLIQYRELPTPFTLAFGVVILPAAAVWGLQRGLSLLPEPLTTLGWGLAGFVTALAVTPFQAAVVARQFLHCMAWRTEVDDEDLAHGLPQGPPDRVRPKLLSAALLPGLLSGGMVLVNPLGWLEVTETDVRESWTNERTIRHSTEAGPGARLPGGARLLPAWTSIGLKLVTCEAGTCVPSSGVLARPARTARWLEPGAALTVRQDGGVVVAFADEDLSGDPERPTHDLVSLVFCVDTRCARPETRRIARLEASVYLPDAHSLAVAMGPGDRPVAARFDAITGGIHVVSCLDTACREPRVTRPVPPAPPNPGDERGEETGLSLAVRPDGRPVIAYRDRADLAIKLLDCRTPDCVQFDVLTLGAGGIHHITPALALDRKGRPLVAFQSRDRERLMLATCTERRCVSTPVSRTGNVFQEVLAMTVNDEGRPTIAWVDSPGLLSLGERSLTLITPLNLTPD